MENPIMNLNDFKTSLTEKVKSEFANLIPDEAMENFVSKTIKEFEENELPKLMLEILREHAKKEINRMLSENSYGSWNSEKNRYEITPALEEILVEAAPKMFGQIMAEVARNTMSSMQGNIY